MRTQKTYFWWPGSLKNKWPPSINPPQSTLSFWKMAWCCCCVCTSLFNPNFSLFALLCTFMNLSLCVYLLQPLYFPTRYGELIPCADSTGQSEPLRSEQTWSFSSTVTVATLLHLVQKQALLSDDLFWYYFQLDAAVHNTLDSLNSAAAFFLIIFFLHTILYLKLSSALQHQNICKFR